MTDTDRITISPTQVDIYELCKRKWGWRYRDKIKTPPNRYAQLGLDVHNVLEKFLIDGTPPDRTTTAGAIALPGLKHLPDPGTPDVEGKFLWELPDEPFDITGKIDWSDVVQEAIEFVRIGDHKTTGDFKWCKTQEELQEDVPATIYARYKMHDFGVERIKCRWVYYRTKGRKASRPVDFDMDLTKIAKTFNRVLEVGREIAGWHQRKSKAIEMPIDPRGCDAFGGCPYRENCNLSSKERLVSLMAQESLKEKMKRKKAERLAQDAAAPASPPPATAAPAPAVNPPEGAQQTAPTSAPAPVPSAQGSLSLKEKMEARKVAVAQPAPAQAPAQPAAQPAPAAAPLVPPAVVPAVDMQGFSELHVDCAAIKSNGVQVIPLSNITALCESGQDVGAYLDTNPLPENTAITMSMRTPEGAAAFEALSARAARVYRGM